MLSPGKFVSYRMAPELESLCEHAMVMVCESVPGMALIRGKKVIEMKASRASKARALEAFLLEPPFAGRQPIFVGDDVTDEDAFVSVQKVGGAGIKVDVGATTANHRVPSAAALREWLRESLAALEGTDSPDPLDPVTAAEARPA